jgi:methylenetetrahydrofolate dehydrogenase (NADP+)/methenyltetrahydrofolate cyclohydrolase
MPTLLDGKVVAAAIQREVVAQVERIRARHGCNPTLAVVLIGENPASKVYINRKRQACQAIGIQTRDYVYPGGLAASDIRALVRELNDDQDVHGILVQLPLPDGVDESWVIDLIDPAKDVDGFHPENLGRLLVGAPRVVPCTPAGVLAILDHYAIPVTGRTAAIVGRSRIVGKPAAALLLGRDATVVTAHSHTRDLPAITRLADVLVVAAGRAGLIGAEHVRPGATIVDVGINRLPGGGMVGDVNFDEVHAIAGAITPVPGGVGPTTVAMLMRNTVELCRQQIGPSSSLR